MIPNTFHTRLPFYKTRDFANQPELQIERVVCNVQHMHPTLNPNNWFPEFICAREWTSSDVLYFAIWDVDNDVVFQDLTSFIPLLEPNYIREYQADINGVPKVMFMFSGYLTVLTMPAGKYQYRLSDSLNKYYSEYFEVACEGFTFLQNLKSFEHLTNMMWQARCYFAGIHYGLFTSNNFWHHLWLRSEHLNPETNIEEDNVTDANGNIISSSHAVDKRILISIPHCSEPVVDAMNTIPLFTSGDNTTCSIWGWNDYAPRMNVEDVEVEKPDYSLNECAPAIKARIQIDPRLNDSGCCDTDNLHCYTDFTAPAPTLTKLSSSSIRVSKGNTLPIQTAEDQSKVPTYCKVDIRYRYNGGSWITISNITYVNLHSGYTLTGLAAGTFDFQIKVKSFWNTSCDSEWSATSTMVLP